MKKEHLLAAFSLPLENTSYNKIINNQPYY